MPNTPPKLIFTPGPVPIHPEIKKILVDQSIHHRSDEFKNILLNIFRKLPEFFGSKNPVILQPVTGSGAMESSLINLLSPKDKVLIINSGKFGNRWIEIANKLELNITEIKIPWGESFKTEHILENAKDKKAILTQLCETSTGALHPIKELALQIKDKDTLLIVDAISALGSIEFETEGTDVVIASSHKTFMSPPGISATCLSNKAWDFYNKSKFKKYYLDLKADLETNQSGQTRFTSFVSIIRGIDWVLNNIDKQDHIKRVTKISKALNLIEDMGFKNFPQNPSPTLTVATLPASLNQKLNPEDLVDKLNKKYDILIANGQGELNNQVIRIGHMGYIQNKDIIHLLRSISEIINYNKADDLVCKAKNILE